MFNTSRYVDFEFGGRRTGDYAGYFLADQQFVQLAPVPGQAARGIYAGVTAMYAPPEFNRVSQYYELRFYGIGLLPARPRDMVSLVISRNVFSNYLVDAALRQGQLAHVGQFVDHRSVYCKACAWYPSRHRTRLHRSPHAGDLYATDWECSQHIGQRQPRSGRAPLSAFRKLVTISGNAARFGARSELCHVRKRDYLRPN